MRAADLDRMDELFLTGTIIEVLPVIRIDKTSLGPPGPVTRTLQAAYGRLVQRARAIGARRVSR
jgi:branched-subunit amino acid aminotransferase/4-amino-4-deoxychorismate lyase